MERETREARWYKGRRQHPHPKYLGRRLAMAPSALTSHRDSQDSGQPASGSDDHAYLPPRSSCHRVKFERSIENGPRRPREPKRPETPDRDGNTDMRHQRRGQTDQEYMNRGYPDRDQARDTRDRSRHPGIRRRAVMIHSTPNGAKRMMLRSTRDAATRVITITSAQD